MGESEPAAEGVVAPVVRRGPGRPVGSRTKVKEGPVGRVKLRDVVARAYSPDQLERILKRLSPDQVARLVGSLEPKLAAETPGTFQLIVTGLAPICPKCGYRSPMADGPVVAVGAVKTEGGNGNGTR